MSEALDQAIARNRLKWERYRKADRILRAVRLKIFDYEDAGKQDKAERLIARCKRLLTPLWDAQYRERARKRADKKMQTRE